MENDIPSFKTCFKCGQSKARDNFYPHKQMADGLLGKCKQCTKIDANAHRLKNIDRIRQYDRDRAQNPDRIKLAIAINQAWRKADSRRSSAHNKVARAIRSGEITKMNCIVCGSDKSMAHHESYDRPLDVVWYCQPHHKQRHKEMVLLEIEP